MLGWFKLRRHKKPKVRARNSKVLFRKRTFVRSASRRIANLPNLFNYVPPLPSISSPLPPISSPLPPNAPNATIAIVPPVVQLETVPVIQERSRRRRSSFYDGFLPTSKETKRLSFYEGIYSEKTHFLSSLGANIPRPLTPRRVHTEPAAFFDQSPRNQKAVNYRGNNFLHESGLNDVPQIPKRFYGTLGHTQNAESLPHPRIPSFAPDADILEMAPQVPAKSHARTLSSPVNLTRHSSIRSLEFTKQDKSRRNSYVPSPLGGSTTSLANETPKLSIPGKQPVIRRPVGGPRHIDDVAAPSSFESVSDPVKPLKFAKIRTSKQSDKMPDEIIGNDEASLVYESRHVSACVISNANSQGENSEEEELALPEWSAEYWSAELDAPKVREDVSSGNALEPVNPPVMDRAENESSQSLLSGGPFSQLSTTDLLQELSLGKASQKVEESPRKDCSALPMKNTLVNYSCNSFMTAPSSPIIFDDAVEELPPHLDSLGDSLSSQRNSIVSSTSTLQSDLPSPVRTDTVSPKFHKRDEEEGLSSSISYPSSAADTLGDLPKSHLVSRKTMNGVGEDNSNALPFARHSANSYADLVTYYM